jgi:hypothetical protein
MPDGLMPQGDKKWIVDGNSLLVDKTRSIGPCTLSLLLLTLQLEIELLLALHCRNKVKKTYKNCLNWRFVY